MKKQKTSEYQRLVEESPPDDQKAPEALESSSEEASTLDSPKKKTKLALCSSFFCIITLIIAIAGVVISIDGLMRLKKWNTELQNFQEQVDNGFRTEQQHLDALENALKNIDKRQKTLDQQLQYYHSVILPVLQKKQPIDLFWQLQKAYSWLQQAQLDLRWSGDWQGALLLLKASENIIEQSNIAQLQSVSSLIRQDISALSVIKPVNEVNLLNQIKCISDDVVVLPAPRLSSQPSIDHSSESMQTSVSEQSGWRAVLHRGLDSIKRIVVIKSRDDNANNDEQPVNSRQMLNDRLFLAFQQIQWAVLKKDNRLFHWGIAQTINLIQQNDTLIDMKNEKTVLCLNHLNVLEQENLTPALPDLEPVCQQLKIYIDTLSNNKATMPEAQEKTA